MKNVTERHSTLPLKFDLRAKLTALLLLTTLFGLYAHGLKKNMAGDLKVIDFGVLDNSQDLTITGTVTDQNGQPLPGASIVEKGSSNGTQTDFDGNFTLSISGQSSIVQISYVGFIAKEISVGEEENISVSLEEDTAALDEVVVVGYGTQKKVNLTGAVGQISGEAVENKPIVNVQEVLQGKVPGLNISNNNGRPGSGASINIRGASSIGGDSGVLIIIDGAPGNIFTINPNDIESISVLKDAASAAIYGARAANGVILVTTKGSKGATDLKVDLTSSIGIQRPQFFIDFVGARDFMELFNLASTNDGFDAPFGADDFTALENGDIPDNQWYKEVFRKTAIIKNNYVSMTTGNEKFTSRLGVGYDQQEGTLIRNEYDRLVVHPKLTYKFNDWLTFDGNVQYTKTNLEEPQGGDGNITSALRIGPTIQIRTLDDENWWGPGGIPGGNPVARLKEGGMVRDQFTEIMTNLTFTITPIKGWNIKPFYSNFSTERVQKSFTKPLTLYNNDGTVQSQEPLSNQTISDSFRRTSRETLQISTDYTFTLGENHNFSLFALASQEVFKGNGFGASVLSPAFENIYVSDIGVGTESVFSAINDEPFDFNESLASYVGRLNYNYKQKYLFEAVVRYDGTSRFLEGNRWGLFPSFSAGWNIHKENFIKNNVNFLSEFKVRASLGQLGDALKIPRYATRNTLGFTSGLYAFSGNLVGGAFANASFIDNLSWERSKTTNFGVDLGFFKQKLTMSFDYFVDDRDNILYREPVPVELGLEPPFTNTLELKNKGFEYLISYKDQIGKDFSFNVDFNIDHTKNNVKNLADAEEFIDGNSVSRLGTILQAPFGLISDGLFQSETEIENSATQVGVKPGNIKYVDQNGDDLINGDDRVILNQQTPFRYGFNLGVNYKNFSLGANLYGRSNTYRYLNSYEGWAFFLSQNARPTHLDSWTPDNPDASYPRLSTTTVSNDQQFSDFWYRKSSFLKLQTLSLGYRFDDNVTDILGMDGARVSLTGQNLGIFTNYEGFDPEGGSYPLPRTITLSLQLNF